MTQFIESLCRLYASHKIDIKQLDKLLIAKKINKQEYDYITSATKVVWYVHYFIKW
jgi:hypothetical protein